MSGDSNAPCEACSTIDAGGSAFCREHERAQIAEGCEEKMAALVAALADHAGVLLVDRRQPKDASISVDAVEMNGERVVRIVLPSGAQSVAVALQPDVALHLARAIVQQAQKAKSPAGLILLG